MHERNKATQHHMNSIHLPHRVAFSRAVAVAGLGAALLLAVAGPRATAHAQAPSCGNTTQGAAAENNEAYVDLEAGGKAGFVCISSSAFTGGKSEPITANGPAGGGCYIVEGIGTSVVVVFRESPAVKANCPDLVRIDVGMQTAAATPAPTTPASTPATPARTATPAATATPTSTPTAAPATPRPPSTGTGTAAEGQDALAWLGITLTVVSVTLGGSFLLARRRARP
ncbi:MAG: hypothetical protein ACKVT1_18900 [Dehalococcoidia bacterium]